MLDIQISWMERNIKIMQPSSQVWKQTEKGKWLAQMPRKKELFSFLCLEVVRGIFRAPQLNCDHTTNWTFLTHPLGKEQARTIKQKQGHLRLNLPSRRLQSNWDLQNPKWQMPRGGFINETRHEPGLLREAGRRRVATLEAGQLWRGASV